MRAKKLQVWFFARAPISRRIVHPLYQEAGKMEYKVNEVIETILKEVPGAPLADTVDTIKFGDGSTIVTGIVTTFIATADVLRRAANLGANFIITHEPTFFNHLDKVDWLEKDPVYAAKRDLIDENNLVIWRFHDHWHMYQPDGILTGLVRMLGWERYQDAEKEFLFHIAPTSLSELGVVFKEKLGIPRIRMVGPAEMTCLKVAVLVGSGSGEGQIEALRESGADVMVCGEASEWQVYEYVRDTNGLGLHKGLLIIGHERSEEPGMAYLAGWLKERLPGLPISHISAGDPLVIR
jgi:putative NIF3 family GTP cyclohydrolase 1 type 2